MMGVDSLLAGHLNAAAIMIIIILSSIPLYGRAFCGWTCHLRGAIEFSDWVLRKLNIYSYQKLMNLSPYQKKITRISDCTGCRACSNKCPQGIDVSREIYYFDGKVINKECIKCYNCVDTC